MMGNICQILPEPEKEVINPTNAQLWTSYTKKQCCHIDTEVYNPKLVHSKTETEIPSKNLPNSKYIISEREQKLEKLKRQLEDEGTELAKRTAPFILSSAVSNKNTEPVNINETPVYLGDLLTNFMKDGADRFEKEAGRKMTYSEMRELWG